MENFETAPKTGPKDFFLHLAGMVTLYVSVGSLIGLVMETIDRLFPDKLQAWTDPYSSGIRFAIASLLVIFPIFIFITKYTNKDLAQNPEKKNLPVRKWIAYLTIFIAAAVIAGTLIALINTFLSGEISARFMMKIFAILIIFNAVFGYFLNEIRDVSAGKRKMFAWVGISLVVCSMAFGFYIMGSPAAQRKFSFDERRVNDLQNIQYEILNFWQTKKILPANLEAVRDPIQNVSLPVDPDTEAPYIYEKTSETTFNLCATFGTKVVGSPSAPSMMGLVDENWEHGIGQVCFERKIDPARHELKY